MSAPAINRYATATPEALEAGKKTHKNADGCNASFIEDQGTVNYNSREQRIEINDEGPIRVFGRADPDDPDDIGTIEQFRIENGAVIDKEGKSRPLQPVESFELPDGTKMTIETTFSDNGKPVSKVTITNTERNGRNHIINKRDWNNDFGLQVANVGGQGALDVSTGSGRKLDKAVADGVKNGGDLGFHRISIFASSQIHTRLFDRNGTGEPVEVDVTKLIATVNNIDLSQLAWNPGQPLRSQQEQVAAGLTNVQELQRVLVEGHGNSLELADAMSNTLFPEELAGIILWRLRSENDKLDPAQPQPEGAGTEPVPPEESPLADPIPIDTTPPDNGPNLRAKGEVPGVNR